MASKRAVIEALAVLASNFAGDVTEEKIGTWRVALSDVSDEALKAGVAKIVTTHTGQFIPPVAVLREAAGANQGPAVNVEAIINAIDKAGYYNPQTGWSHPRVERVRELFGDAVAEAYGAVGGAARLFSSDDTGRGIALRDFQKVLESAVESGVPLLPPVAKPKALTEATP